MNLSPFPNPSASQDGVRPLFFSFCLLLLLLLPFFISWFAGPIVPIGDDWKLFENLDQSSFQEALLVNTHENEGRRFRPLVNGAVWFERNILGCSFQGNMRLGLLWIGLSGVALFLLLLRMGLNLGRAWLGALLFLGHPAAAEMYGWASTRVDSMGTTFSLLALWAGLGKSKLHPLWATFLLLCAFLSKESTYPLAVAAPLFFWILSRKEPSTLLGPPLALGLTFGLKKIFVTKVFASWWAASIPFLIRLKGWLLLAFPLLLWPLGTSAALPSLAKILTWIYAGSMLLSLLTLPLQKQPRNQRIKPLLALGALLLFTLSVTGGVPPHSDLGGGRVWFLPSAFLCALFATYGTRSFLSISAPIGLGLLLLNLAPWARARTKMNHFLDRLHVEVAKHERALEVTNLESHHGPVPLFFLMTEFYTLSFRGPRFDRPLLMRKPANQDELAFQAKIEKRWLQYMTAQRRNILRLRWNPEKGTLEEFK